MKLIKLFEEFIFEAGLEEPKCNQWKTKTFKQGDGITTPKITITKTPTLIEGLYEGPDDGGCIQRFSVNNGDTPHQLAGITVYYEAAPYLKELYARGVYVKPDMKKITMQRVPNKMFKISIPLIKTTEDLAITSINERGGMGGGEGNLKEINDIENNPDHKLIEKIRVTAGDITETFICFRNIVNFPIKTQAASPQGQQAEPINITGTDLEDFKNKIKTQTAGKSLNLDTIQLDMDKLTFSVKPGPVQIFSLALRWNMPADPTCAACDNTVSKNPEYRATSLKTGKFENSTRMYSLIVLYPKS